MHPYDQDPLIWWKFNEHRYPKLAKAARDYVAGRCTSFDTEIFFSEGRRMVSDYRHNRKLSQSGSVCC